MARQGQPLAKLRAAEDKQPHERDSDHHSAVLTSASGVREDPAESIPEYDGHHRAVRLAFEAADLPPEALVLSYRQCIYERGNTGDEFGAIE